MKKVFTHQNSLIVGNARNLLEEQGIATELRNEFASSAMGETAPLETWPELWVGDADYARARELLDSALVERDSADWTCERCGEINGAAFECCWQCEAPRPGSAV